MKELQIHVLEIDLTYSMWTVLEWSENAVESNKEWFLNEMALFPYFATMNCSGIN